MNDRRFVRDRFRPPASLSGVFTENPFGRCRRKLRRCRDGARAASFDSADKVVSVHLALLAASALAFSQMKPVAATITRVLKDLDGPRDDSRAGLDAVCLPAAFVSCVLE
ncbi:hypothetical protein [Bradyrhizobium sp. I71]|uniref:hypothetical protein n=1 Tax=Bradyrhizobium sp. I71 TaxID=2590772 RepID=UPI001EF84CE9|nr:hypothetical protein [Bradyrhizobium sp. I71]